MRLAGTPLAALVLMTDDERLPDPVRAARALPKGSMVILRARDPKRRRALAAALQKVARERGLFLLIAGEAGPDGVHLAEADAGKAAAYRARQATLVTVAAHSPAVLCRAAWADALILSAVFPTQSHPGRAALGPVRANLFARQCPLPVYALGGITAQNAARLSGFCGIAAIGVLAF
jgi:thiamine-phosphate pyrophosphorylase